MKKVIIIFIFFATPLFAGKVERLGFYNIQELLEDDNLTYKIIKSCVSLNSAITEITRKDHPELSKSLDLQSTETIIGNRQIYTSSMGEGKTAVEKQRKGNAVDEIKKLSEQILQQLN